MGGFERRYTPAEDGSDPAPLERIEIWKVCVLSKDYEKKDTEIGAPFYLEQGVKDVILFNPRTREVMHRRRDGDRLLKSPVTIELECGCQITV